ncbi:sodium/solute symporter [candidate division KSB1 bacterium]|nr:sodium/solute symporter [candidate division KSB1 bacterium]
MGFAPLDYAILFIYLVGVTVFGVWVGKRQRNTRDYFLGDRNLPWTAVCFSVVATETSTLTFISIPGLAYLTNLNFLQITLGYLIGRIIISKTLLPAYYRGELYTAYELLRERFGSRMQRFSSMIFQITRLLADGVRLFATAIPLAVITGWSYSTCIIIIALFTIIYTYIGGIRAVVWMDVIQMAIYIGGAILAGFVLLDKLPNGWSDVVNAAQADNKFQFFYLGFENSLIDFFQINYTFLSGILGGAFLSMASHGSDQLIVQRLLSCNDLKSSQKALIMSGVIVIFQFALFLVLGLMLYTYYGGIDIRSDEVLPRFIVEGLPIGVSGTIIAGVFAAAMSTLSGSLNSLASASMLDFIKPKWGANWSEERELLISRIVTFVWGLVFIAGAMLFKDKDNPVVELGLAIASFTYGGLLGTFFLGSFYAKARENDALVAMWGAIFFMTWLIGQQGVVLTIIVILNILAGYWIWTRVHSRKHRIFQMIWTSFLLGLIISVGSPQIAWPWYVAIGCTMTWLIGVGLSYHNKPLPESEIRKS